jgi:hypothetical protein
LLIILTAYLIVETIGYYLDREKTGKECEELSNKIVVVDFNNTETWEGWQNWTICNQEYINQFMMFEIMGIFSILSIFLAILSWRFDVLKQNPNKK